MSTKHTKVKTMIDTLRKSDEAVTFASLCETAKEKYPQDVQAAMLALVEVGLVESGKDGRAITYRWISDKPAPRRPRAKKAEVAEEVTA
jgi:hypothetical protein